MKTGRENFIKRIFGKGEPSEKEDTELETELREHGYTFESLYPDVKTMKAYEALFRNYSTRHEDARKETDDRLR